MSNEEKDKKPQERETLNPKVRLTLALRGARLRQEADAREERLRSKTSKERKDIKALKAEASECEKQAVDGYRWVPARSLFSDKAEKKREKNAKELTAAQREAKNKGDRDRRAKERLEKAKGGNGHAGGDLGRAESRERSGDSLSQATAH